MAKIADIIIYAGIVQGFFLALLLHRGRDDLKGPNTMLSALLIVLSLAIIHSVFVIPYVGHTIGDPIKVKEPFVFLVGPLLYFYARRLIGADQGLRARQALHLIPFFLFFAVNFPLFVHGPTSWYARSFTAHTTAATLVVWVVLVLQYGSYLVAIGRATGIHLKRVRQEMSNIDDADLSWIRFFMVVFLLLLAFLMVVLFSLVHFGAFGQFERIVSLVFSLSIFALGYKGLFQKGLFRHAWEPAPQIQPERLGRTGVARDDGTPGQVLHYVEEKKPFLDPDLTLTQLAGELGMGRNQLSEVINSGLGTNFYEFINKYRVEEVKQLLADPAKQNLKIIALAFEAGFPSKSSFNNVFKRYTGLTPSEYRDRLL